MGRRQRDEGLGGDELARRALVLLVPRSGGRCRGTGGQSEALLSMLTERSDLPAARLAAEDSFIATGPAYATTLPSRDSIVAAATKLWNAL